MVVWSPLPFLDLGEHGGEQSSLVLRKGGAVGALSSSGVFSVVLKENWYWLVQHIQ